MNLEKKCSNRRAIYNYCQESCYFKKELVTTSRRGKHTMNNLHYKNVDSQESPNREKEPVASPRESFITPSKIEMGEAINVNFKTIMSKKEH